MRRAVSWVERTTDGVKREVRVAFVGGGKVRWQAKRADEEHWVYDFEPSAAEWAELELRLERRYRRRNAPFKDLELVRRLRQRAAGGDVPADNGAAS